MNPLTLTFAQARIMLLELLRMPAFLVFSIGFPALFFTIFGASNADSASIADYETLSFMAFAAVGISFSQFGVGIAVERGRPWERYLRTLPTSPVQRFGARAICAITVGALAAGLVAVVARIMTPIDFTAMQWIAAFAFTLLGAIPFALMGIALGYIASPRAAVPISTACNLLLAYAGGLWMPPRMLPDVVQAISPYLPTRQFGELLWSIAAGSDPLPAASGLIVYALVFAGIASFGYRRDERVRYA